MQSGAKACQIASMEDYMQTDSFPQLVSSYVSQEL